ncbi:MAG TPA: hypothetical protein VFT72_15885 [Opitutaceae bacterium]|nr:hypothetical protein [Opitutaceae bacterium]
MVAAIVGVVVYVIVSSKPSATVSPTTGDGASKAMAALQAKPYILFRNTQQGAEYGRIAAVPLGDSRAARTTAPLLLDRVYGNSEGGLALRANRGSLTTYEAISFDRNFQPTHTFKLAGAPSRARVSPSGRFGASTVFVNGDSYNSGGFSTRTTIYDLKRAEIVGELETFAIERDGQGWKKADFNFWGVTFAHNDDTFYATLLSGDVPYLIKGSISKKTATVIHDHVECPSLSPDERRVAFKSRQIIQGRRVWLLKILDLKTGAETGTPETRNVDDQPEWIDDTHLAYSLPHSSGGGADIWSVETSAQAKPEMLIPDAYSPCVVRP